MLDLLIYLIREHLIDVLALVLVGVELADFEACLLEVINQYFEFLLVYVLELLGAHVPADDRDVEETGCSTSLLTNSLELDVHDIFVLDVDYWFLYEDQR